LGQAQQAHLVDLRRGKAILFHLARKRKQAKDDK
jgi:hypothetical protein